MSLAEKIEEIKRKPEHIRLRYVWFFVSLSMFFIITLWIFSLQADNAGKKEDTNQIMDLNSFGAELEQQKKELQQTTKNIQDGGEEIKKEIQAQESGNAVGENEAGKVIEKTPGENTGPNSFPGEAI